MKVFILQSILHYVVIAMEIFCAKQTRRQYMDYFSTFHRVFFVQKGGFFANYQYFEAKSAAIGAYIYSNSTVGVKTKGCVFVRHADAASSRQGWKKRNR